MHKNTLVYNNSIAMMKKFRPNLWENNDNWSAIKFKPEIDQQTCHPDDHSGYGLSQRDKTLHYNIIWHWLSPNPEWPLHPYHGRNLILGWHGFWTGLIFLQPNLNQGELDHAIFGNLVTNSLFWEIRSATCYLKQRWPRERHGIRLIID